MAISDFVTVSITSATRTPSQVGFGTPLVLGMAPWADRVRTYTSLTDMAADGIVSTGLYAAGYWVASAIFAQNPRVKQIKYGRRTNAWTQKVQLVVTTATVGTVYKVTIAPLGGSAQTFIRTVPGSSTIAAEAAAIKALIDASSPTLAMTTAVVGGTTVECTANVAGTMFVFTGRSPELEIFESTAAPAAISTDLDACSAADDDFYGVASDSCSKAEALLIAAWTETKLKVFFATSGDTENGKVGAASTLLKQLAALSYTRTSTWCDYAVLPSFLGAGIMGEEFPWAPGTGTYNGKTVAGVTVDAPSATAEAETVTQKGNVYTTVASLNVTRPGKVASGEFIDVVIGRDWLTAQLKTAIFGAEVSGRRLPYTDGGVATLRNTALGVLRRAQGTVAIPGFLDPGVDPIVTAPLVADVDATNRANRIYPNLTFSAKISGAIHMVNFTGVISP